jgi:indolepyruvate ferredoxin oxidoreductase alpha subunit
MNERFAEQAQDFGIVLQGGMYNAVIRALQLLDCATPTAKARSRCMC